MSCTTENENPNFRLKSVAEFLDGNHHFYIPSYQRGYRWDDKEVKDLLDDIWGFANNAQNKKCDFYCLQPIVVNKKADKTDTWIVIDGQQRLTALFLLLSFIKKDSRTPFVTKSIMYDIKYNTRNELDFQNPNPNLDIDSYHVFQTKSIIAKWFSDRIDEVDYSAFEKVLFNKSKEIPQVKFIWYVVENDDDIESIKIFNNLNKGKIGLTNAELIKALFILRAKLDNEKLNTNELAFEWNEIENALHNDQLWYFLSGKEYNPATRIDIIFDFLTGKCGNDDSDYSYRKFQDLYDNSIDQYWKDKGVNNFADAWKKVKEVFQTFIYWFENVTLYHYVGYLVSFDVSLNTIFSTCDGKSKTQVVKELQSLIRKEVLNGVLVEQLDELDYIDRDRCRKVLLFFNIETSIRQQQNQDQAYYKFPFDLYKLYNWDIEHVNSQTENTLTKVEEKIIWLSYIENINDDAEEWESLKEKSRIMLKVLTDQKKDIGNKFKDLFIEIIEFIQKDDLKDKDQSVDNDTIGNLALLDDKTNRGYGNALFPTKRMIIIEKDKVGIFIPICTKNLFLKYYSDDDKNSSKWKNRWTHDDKKAYLKAMHETVDFILEKEQ